MNKISYFFKSAFSKLSSVFDEQAIRPLIDIRKLQRLRNAYRLVLFLSFLAGIVLSSSVTPHYTHSTLDWLRNFIVPLTVSYIAALVGTNLFLRHNHRLLLLTQICFLSYLGLLFSKTSNIQVDTLYGECALALLLISCNFLFFATEFTAVNNKSVIFTRRRTLQISIALIAFFFPVAVLYFSNEDNINLFWFCTAIVSLVYLIAVVSFISFAKRLFHGIYLIVFQSAFSGVLVLTFLYSTSKDILSSSLAKDVFLPYLLSLFLITAGGVLFWVIDKLLFSFWRRRLVSAQKLSEVERPISIYPEASTYIDVHGHALWLKKFFETSDGGVIGLTGIRGAGKSALLNKVISDLGDQYFTLHITSPVHSKDRMEFFMMVCREVCTKVINDIERKIFHLRDSSAAKATEGLISSIRFVLLFLIVIAGVVVLNSQGFSPLRNNAAFEVLTEDSSVSSDYESYISYSGNVLGTIDKMCIDSLIAQINTFSRDTNSTFDAIAIVPYSSGGSLQALPVRSDRFNLNVFHRSFTRQYAQTVAEFDSTFTASIASQFPQDLLYNFCKNQLILPGIFKLRARDTGRGNRLTNLYMIFISEIARIGILEVAYPIAVSGGVYLSSREAEIGTFTAEVGSMVGVNNRFSFPKDIKLREDPHPLKLMSWILLESYYRSAVGSNKANIVFSRRVRAEELRDYLVAYRDELNSQTEQSASNIGGTPDLTKYLSAFLENTWLVLLGTFLVLIIAGRWIFRKINDLMSTIINFKAYGLLQRSRDFLVLLSYSESKGRSGELSLPKGLRLSATRTLTERTLTLPTLNNRFIEYVTEVSDLFNRKIIIAIDELDKIDDVEVVKHILQEVKGALFVKNTYYLISISEDAARSFEHRLSSGRDIIESTFDKLIKIGRLECKQAWPIIGRRLNIGDISQGHDSVSGANLDITVWKRIEANTVAIALLAGGIPREIIRNFREIILNYQDFSIPDDKQACIFLFKKKIEEFVQSIARIQIPGKNSLILFRKLKEVRLILGRDRTLNTEDIHSIIEILQQAISTIDPRRLHSSISSSSSAKQRLHYEALEDDIKSLIELLIQAHVLLFYSNGSFRDSNKSEPMQRRIFNAYDALDSNPTLAEHILIGDSANEQFY